MPQTKVPRKPREGKAGLPRKAGRPARPTVQADQAREKLLQASITLFARRGYDAVSTGDIAKAANYAQSMVHYHFGSKEQIWREAVIALMKRRGPMFSPMRLKHAQLDPLAKLEMLIRQLAAANAQEPDYARIIMQESIANSERLDWLVKDFVSPGFEVFDQAIREAQEKGLIKNLPVHDLTNIITSTVSLTFSLGTIIQKIYGIDPSSDENVQSLTAAIVEILFAGLIDRT